MGHVLKPQFVYTSAEKHEAVNVSEIVQFTYNPADNSTNVYLRDERFLHIEGDIRHVLHVETPLPARPE